jgi:Mg-chelatase subunit ChlD
MRNFKRIISIMLVLIMSIVSIGGNISMNVSAAQGKATIYFIDNTPEGWIANDSARIELVDNTNGHDHYMMTKINNKTWSVEVPASAYNITFNRYNKEKSVLWNSWSAGGRDGKVTYTAEGSSNGQWTGEVFYEYGFEAGDIVYLDLTNFTDWLKDNAVLYVNFTTATKSENGGNNINISSANTSLYSPVTGLVEVEDNIYSYKITEEDAGASTLRFWRGNSTTLWNCSIALTYKEFEAGNNCVKVTGWSESGSLKYYEHKTTQVKLSLDTSGMDFVESEDGDFYFISDKIKNLSGTLTGASNVKEIEYSISDMNEEILIQGNIDVNEEWFIENIGLMLGYNLIKFVVKTKSEDIEYQYIINNTNINNMANLGISTDTDTDGDGLPDFYENLVGLDATSRDTDGDGLDDFMEIFLSGVSPLSRDTDEDGILDGDEDSDGDGLTNLEEVAFGTSLSEEDSDQDGLTDYEEVYIYFTNPLERDTDGDGLSDGWEVKVGSNPLSYDSDFEREVTADSFEGQCTVPTVTIEGLSAEQVTSLAVNKVTQGMLANDEIPGLLDCGYDFSVQGEFEEAKITFEFDENLLNDEDFYPAIYYYNEEEQILEELDNQVVSGNSVSATTTHFSKYILLNKIEYDLVWKYELLYNENENVYSKLDIVFVIDSSGSMSWNDSSDVRIDVTKNFIDRLTDSDRAAVVDFDSTAKVISGFTSDKTVLKAAANRIDSNGGTDLSVGISKAISLFEAENYSAGDTLKYIIMLTDGDGSYSTTYTLKAANESIVIYTIGLGSDVSTSVLTAMANGTGGSYYHANEAEQLYSIIDVIADKSDYYKDSDGDGINDYFEKAMTSGQLVLGTGAPISRISYLDADSDDDNLLDGQEIRISKSGDRVYVYMNSNPTIADTDGDGLQDDVDSRPLIPDLAELLIHQTRDREGIQKKAEVGDNTVADDLTFNDYSYWDLLGISLFPYSVAGVTPEFMMWGEMIPLFYIGGVFSNSDMQDTLLDMVDTFRYGNTSNKGKTVKSGDTYDDTLYIKYVNSALTKEVKNDDSTQVYTKLVKDYVINTLSNNGGNLSALRYGTDSSADNLINKYMNGNFDKSPYPIFTEKTNLALSIAIHQFQGHNITVTNYICNGNTFRGTLQFHFYDHFGLDETDEIIWPGFCDWFALQHYDRFNGKYVPFITTVDFTIDFSGTLN